MRQSLVLIFCLFLIACGDQKSEQSALNSIVEPAAKDMSKADAAYDWAPDCYNAFLTEVTRGDEYELPWMTIYNAELQPLLHKSGFRMSTEEGWRASREWKQKLDNNVVLSNAPTMAEVRPFLLNENAALPDADITFVKYGADWCTPCKMQSVQVQEFRDDYPELTVAHVEVQADFMKMKGLSEDEMPVCTITTVEKD